MIKNCTTCKHYNKETTYCRIKRVHLQEYILQCENWERKHIPLFSDNTLDEIN